tara:strand:+ start:384 stop:779 length:396 start_codon:yes stop_codon:yes gene_type:complete
MTEQTQELRTNHNVRVVKLVTNETLLCLFGEVKNDEDKVIGYRILYPYVLSLGSPNEDGTLPINYTRWCPFSPVQEYKIPGEHLIAVTYPDNNILDNFVQELGNFGIKEENLFFTQEEVSGDQSEPDQASE